MRYYGVLRLRNKNAVKNSAAKRAFSTAQRRVLERKEQGFCSVYPFIITQCEKKVKRRITKKQLKRKKSIFIDEKIYSVNRLKNK